MAGATVLVVDDERNMLRTLAAILETAGYEPVVAGTGTEGLEQLAARTVQAVVCDARMPGMDGFEFLARARQRYPRLPVIMITAYATPQLAVKAVKGGAADYLSKPFAPEELLHVIRTVLHGEQLEEENRQLKGLLGRRFDVDDLLGDCAAMQQVRDLIRVAAPTDASVLLLGESGTGKEMAASALHVRSLRAKKPYLSINCAAIPENLLESELFGHERGAFTGAVKQRLGRFEDANGGTLFLDEIGDMSPQLQSKLLRVLEAKSFQRVGGNAEITVDVRVIAATNQDIRSALAAGKFRTDLYHRLNVVEIKFPPLRERGDDIEMLAACFLRQFAEALRKRIEGFSPAARELLRSYHWPGNVRELRNAIERAVIVETTHLIQAPSLPTNVGDLQGPIGDRPVPANLEDALAEYERTLIENALRQNRSRVGDAAQALGISRHALRYRMQRLGMRVDDVG